jgi:hypothetical protein
MAKKDTKFKKGKSGNPSGRPTLSPEERKLLKLTKAEVARLLNLVCGLTHAELLEKYKAIETPGIEKLFIKTILDGLDGDSVKSSEFILNRIVGKVQEDVSISMPRPTVIVLEDGKEIVLGATKGDEE